MLETQSQNKKQSNVENDKYVGFIYLLNRRKIIYSYYFEKKTIQSNIMDPTSSSFSSLPNKKKKKKELWKGVKRKH